MRRMELQRACDELGVKQVDYLQFQDGHLAHIRDGEGHARLETALRRAAPDVVVTFSPDGISDHPDHVAISRWTIALFDKLKPEVDLFAAVV